MLNAMMNKVAATATSAALAITGPGLAGQSGPEVDRGAAAREVALGSGPDTARDKTKEAPKYTTTRDVATTINRDPANAADVLRQMPDSFQRPNPADPQHVKSEKEGNRSRILNGIINPQDHGKKLLEAVGTKSQIQDPEVRAAAERADKKLVAEYILPERAVADAQLIKKALEGSANLSETDQKAAVMKVLRDLASKEHQTKDGRERAAHAVLAYNYIVKEEKAKVIDPPIKSTR